jgi:uncharacterized caspase-like protein
MRRALRDFSQQARDADIAVVFYAGHGMEMNGVNYLIPVDATLVRFSSYHTKSTVAWRNALTCRSDILRSDDHQTLVN